MSYIHFIILFLLVVAVVLVVWSIHRGTLKRFLKLKTEADVSKQRLEALIEKDLWYNALFQSAHDAILIMDEGVILDCNLIAADLFLVNRRDISGNRFVDFSVEYQPFGELSARRFEEIKEDAISKSFVRFEWKMRKITAATFDAEVSMSAFSSNKKTFFITTIRDVSERKLHEREYENYKMRLEVEVSEKTEDLKIVNSRLVSTNEELQKRNVQLHSAIELLKTEINERKQIQEKFELSDEKYRSFVLQSGIGIVLSDSLGNIIEWNNRMSEYTGVSKENALGLRLQEIEFQLTQLVNKSEWQFEKFKTIIEDYLNRLPNAPVVNLEVGYSTTVGKYNLSLTLFPILTSGGLIVGIIVKDITESKSTETELQNYRTELENLVIKRTGEVMDYSQRYQEILRNTFDAIYLIDVSQPHVFRIISINHVMEKFLKMSESEVIAKGNVENVFGHDLSDKIIEGLVNCKTNDNTIERLDNVIVEEGKRSFRTLFVPLRESNGNINRIACFTRDVTAEQQIREEQDFNSVLFNTLQSLILVLDEQGRIVRFNKVCEELTGLNAKQVEGVNYWEVFYENNLWEQARCYFSEIKEKRASRDEQSAWDNQLKSNRQILWHYSWIESNTGLLQYIVISGTDITERLEIETALRKSEAKFRSIFNNSLDGIAITGANRMFIESNPTILLRTGYSRDELLRMSTFDIFPGKYHETITSRLLDMLKGEELNFFEAEIITKDNKLIPVELNGKLVDFDGQSAILTFIRDISERKVLENKLMEVVVETEEKERRALAGDLHDELGPLLATLRIYVSTLARKLQATEHNTVLELMQNVIKESVDKTRELSNNLSPHLLDNFGLQAAIKAEIDNAKLILPVVFNCNVGANRFESRIETVFYRIAKELMNNTRKYAKASEAIITIDEVGDMLIMQYKDNGIGFDFEKHLMSGKKGIGLLSISNRIRSINASFDIKTSPGHGFEFVIRSQLKNT